MRRQTYTLQMLSLAPINRPPERIKVRDLDFLPETSDLFIFHSNLILELSEIVEGAFLNIPIFCQKLDFQIFGPTSPC